MTTEVVGYSDRAWKLIAKLGEDYALCGAVVQGIDGATAPCVRELGHDPDYHEARYIVGCKVPVQK